jgi:hypothetical protein
MKTKIVCCRTAYSKPVKQEVNGTVMLPPLVFPTCGIFNLEVSVIAQDSLYSFPELILTKLATICSGKSL